MKAKAQKIGDGVYWIGVLDWDLRSYHGYTLDGTTYNAYIVFGEKVAIIDNAYPGKTEEMMARIEDAFEQEGREVKVDYIVQNHVEKDHSGVLYDLWKKFDAPIYCSKIAQGGLLRHYPKLEGADFNIVGTGDSLDLGGKTLAFLDAFLLHWPDSMFTLLAEDGILFPNDAFGQHLCFESYSLTMHSASTYAMQRDLTPTFLNMFSWMLLKNSTETSSLHSVKRSLTNLMKSLN